ncbi:LysR substrate-binding domain-containing protein [Nocardiopsis exhalans]|uniref:DNA-binding transcriptional LysR family regulator n=2 Tax=Nocardiopsis TaxID=2013 RepID=A0A840WE15_9ACTN|nr:MULTISPECIES: LysR substrate-binding domain-containing protein [Nocardiopsis]MBB5491251.1 DNA-binding transcriptional LysR family regulator [Nocardiopsis metallicus]QRN79658.1 MAG: LysR family transcriptional regulator [Nocardiopsis sp. BM-2018]USY17807.1 LysR substrate-binding domain-containing protein [Nocardiopsis exhalans]
MNLHHLEAFLAVAEELHFGRAAERLHMAQPPLTRAIKQLERDLGAQLFVRTTRSVHLTTAGQALIGPANDVLEGCRVARSAVRSAGRGETGLVRLGFAGPSSHLLVGDLSRLVRQRRPGIELRLRSTTYANEALRSVIDGELDLALVRWSVRPPEIAQRVVAEEHYVLVVPEHHRLAERETVSIAECRDEPFVALPAAPGSIVRETFIRAAYEAGFSPDIVQVASDSWTLMALVGAGVGLSFTLDTAVANVPRDRIRLVRLAEEFTPSYARLAWRRDAVSPALREVLLASEEALPTPEHLVGVEVP